MKKSLLFLATSFLCSSLFAQHYEWSCAQINNNQVFESADAAVAAGYQTLWGSNKWLGMPGKELINNDRIKISLPFAYNYLSTDDSKYPGYNKYGYKLVLGTDPKIVTKDAPFNFDNLTEYIESGLENSPIFTKIGDSDQGNAVMHAMLVAEVAPKAEGEDEETAALTIRWSRGQNSGMLIVLDVTKQLECLHTITRVHPDFKYINVSRINIQQGHTYYILGSDQNSTGIYSIEYDNCASDKFEVAASEENSTLFWDCNSLPNSLMDKDAAVAAGYQTLWGSGEYLGMPSGNLAKDEEVTISLPNAYNYIYKGNGKFSGYSKYAYKLFAASPIQDVDGVIDPSNFLDGVESNEYCLKGGDSDQGNPVMYTILKIDVAPIEGDPVTGRIILNYSSGSQKRAIFVVDATKELVVYRDANRCPSANVKTQTAIFSTVPGHTYYIFSNNKSASMEFYAIGYCSPKSEKFDALNGSTSSIAAIDSKPGFEKNVMYNILGQRVNGNAKGIVIMNGKKMLVK